MTQALGTPYALAGGAGVLAAQHSARLDRIAMGASFRPSSAALGATSGMLHGPAGTMGELTLVSDALLRVAPFVAVIQGTHNAAQGQYVVPNTEQRDLAVPGKDAAQYRRALIVTRVADSVEAGVASSATTDGAWLEIVSGTLHASTPVLPTAPANAVVMGELYLPSAASGQPVGITPYNPRTMLRGGIQPVIDDALTHPGHGGEPGRFVGQYRDHPVWGLQRWSSLGEWRDVGAMPLAHVFHIAGGQAFNDAIIGGWDTAARFDRLAGTANPVWTKANNGMRAPWDGWYRCRAETQFTGGVDQNILIQRLTANSTTGSPALRSSTHRIFPNETYASTTFEGYLSAGTIVRVNLFSGSNPAPTLTSNNFGTQRGYLRMEWLGRDPGLAL